MQSKNPPHQRSSLADIFHNEYVAFLVLAVSLLITALGWRIAAQYVEQRAHDRFQFEVDEARDRILKRMLEYEQVLRGGIALFETMGQELSREQWREYVTTLQIEKYFPGIQGIGYAQMLAPEELSEHVAAIRAEGFPDYKVQPEGERELYSAIVFLEPFDWRNQRAFGYDMFSNAVRQAAMVVARDSGQPAISGRVTLVQETDQDVQAGFLMYLPLYRAGMPAETVAQRRAALRGFVYSPFRTRDLMRGILGRESPYLDFSIYDGTQQLSAETLLYNSTASGTIPERPNFSTTDVIELPGRSWSVTFHSRPLFDRSMESSQPEVIAFGGLAVDILLFLVILSIAGERQRVQHKADVITAQLRDETRRLRLAQEATRTGIWDLNLGDNTVHWDERMFELYGLTEKDFDNSVDGWSRRVHPDDLQATVAQLQQVVREGKDFATQFRVLRPNGGVAYIEANAVVQHDVQGQPSRIIGINRDVTAQVLDEQRLRLAASVFHHAHEGIVITDKDARIIEINPTFTTITGYERDEVLGKKPSILSSGHHGEGIYAEMWEALARDGFWRGELWNRRKSGESYAELLTISAVDDVDGNVSHYVGVFSDITRLKEQQVRLERMAKYDPLTQLPNRVLLADRMQQSMAQSRRSGKMLAVCYLDLDRFKPINDRLGHHSGDELLVMVARRLNEHLRESDSAARLGGDEFVLLLTQLDSVEECNEVLQRLLHTLSQPYRLTAEEVKDISASIGVTLFPADDVDSDTLLRHADQAMYIAKQQGRGRYHLFDPEFDRLTQANIEEVLQVQRALDGDEFVLYYQPKVDMRRGTVVGMEALLRWQHPQRGLLLPGEFLPLIENSQFSLQLGEWVLRHALEQMQQWQAQGVVLGVSVNISGLHLQQTEFSTRLSHILGNYPEALRHQLELEVLETTALDDVLHVSEVIGECHRQGVSFSLDDFGTGYSSLTYLKRLPVDTLKIDQSFVHDMLEDPEDLAIIDGIIGLARAFHRKVIAEGVESLSHGAQLLRMGCDLGQGHGIARAMPAQEVLEWVANYSQPAIWSTAGQIDWPRNDLPLLSAEIEHRRWVDDLITSVTAGSVLIAPPPLDDRQCRFSNWYHGQGSNSYGHLEAFREIDPVHHQIHQLGQRMVELERAGEQERALQMVPQLRQLRNEIQGRLDDLKSSVAAEVLARQHSNQGPD